MMKLVCTIVVLLLLLSASASAELIAHWAFENNYSDTSGSTNVHDGTQQGNSVFSTGPNPTNTGGLTSIDFGLAMNLDGSNDCIRVTNHADFAFTSMTFTAWVKHASWLKNYQSVMTGTGTTYRLNRNGAGSDELSFYSPPAVNALLDSGGNSVADGLWHHFAAVIDAGASKAYLYMDGVLVNQTDTGGAIAAPTGDIYVGGKSKFSDTWSGDIDDARFYDSALSLSEIQALSGIPEPATIALLGLGGLVLLRRRR